MPDVTGGQQFLLAASRPIRIEYGTHLWDNLCLLTRNLRKLARDQRLWSKTEMFIWTTYEHKELLISLGETQNIAAESLDHDSGPGSSWDQTPQEIPPTQSEDHKVLKVRRSFIQQDMIRHFEDDSCTGIQLTFSIINDMGKAELGAGEGVTREVFTFFVLETLCKCDDSGGGGGYETISYFPVGLN